MKRASCRSAVRGRRLRKGNRCAQRRSSRCLSSVTCRTALIFVQPITFICRWPGGCSLSNPLVGQDLAEGHAMTNRQISVQTLRSTAAIIVGEVLLYSGTWFVQERIFHHVTYSDDVGILVGAGLLTPIAAVVAGFAVAAIAATRPYLHLVPMCTLIIAETAYLYSRGLVDGPIWFGGCAGLPSIVGALRGAVLTVRS